MTEQKKEVAIQKFDNAVEIWDNDRADKIRQLFAPNLSNDEFGLFWGLGKFLQANPFTREIWAVKYDKSKPAQVFLGRDFYRKKAQEQSDYDGHVVDAVYENDEFRVESGIPKHSYNLKERGKLFGAYCVVFKKKQGHPFMVYVELNEYHKGQSTWNEKPATMIKKVAEAQALRGAYQGLFRSTYDESEAWTEAEVGKKSIDISDTAVTGNADQQQEEKNKNGNGEESKNPGVVLQYKSNIISCKTVDEVEELRATAKGSFENKNMGRNEFKAIAAAADEKVKGLSKVKQ